MKYPSFIATSTVLALLCSALPAVASDFPSLANLDRVCGKSAPLPNGAGYVGLLVRMQQERSPFEPIAACDNTKKLNVQEVFKNDPAVAPYLGSLKWTNHSFATCSSVGANFMSRNDSTPNMCAYMKEMYYSYTVVKDASKNATTYVKRPNKMY